MVFKTRNYLGIGRGQQATKTYVERVNDKGAEEKVEGDVYVNINADVEGYYPQTIRSSSQKVNSRNSSSRSTTDSYVENVNRKEAVAKAEEAFYAIEEQKQEQEEKTLHHSSRGLNRKRSSRLIANSNAKNERIHSDRSLSKKYSSKSITNSNVKIVDKNGAAEDNDIEKQSHIRPSARTLVSKSPSSLILKTKGAVDIEEMPLQSSFRSSARTLTSKSTSSRSITRSVSPSRSVSRSRSITRLDPSAKKTTIHVEHEEEREQQKEKHLDPSAKKTIIHVELDHCDGDSRVRSGHSTLNYF